MENVINSLRQLLESCEMEISKFEKMEFKTRSDTKPLFDELLSLRDLTDSILNLKIVDINGRIPWDVQSSAKALSGFFGKYFNSVSSSQDGMRRYSETFYSLKQEFERSAMLLITILMARHSNSQTFLETKNAVDGYMSDTVAIFDEMAAKLQTVQKQAEEITELRERVISSAQEFEIAKFGKEYKKLSETSRSASWVWLIASIVLITGTIWFAWMLMNEEEARLSKYASIIQHPSALILLIGPRLVIFSGLFVAIGVSLRMYKANKHNQIINKHRQNSLDTFETFIKTSGEDKDTKNAILFEVTRTIFGNQDTGFSSGDKDSDSYSKIVEIVKGGSGS